MMFKKYITNKKTDITKHSRSKPVVSYNLYSVSKTAKKLEASNINK